MKEKLFKKGFKKRLFSVVLALAMVITLLPVNSIGTMDIVVSAIAKKASKVASLFGNLRLKIHLNSSRFCSQIIALLG